MSAEQQRGTIRKVVELPGRLSDQAKAKAGEVAAFATTAFSVVGLVIAETGPYLQNSSASVRDLLALAFVAAALASELEREGFHALANPTQEPQGLVDKPVTQQMPVANVTLVPQGTPLTPEQLSLAPVQAQTEIDEETVFEDISGSLIDHAREFTAEPEQEAVMLDEFNRLREQKETEASSSKIALFDMSDTSSNVARVVSDRGIEQDGPLLTAMSEAYQEVVAQSWEGIEETFERGQQGPVVSFESPEIFGVNLRTLIAIEHARENVAGVQDGLKMFAQLIDRGFKLSKDVLTRSDPSQQRLGLFLEKVEMQFTEWAIALEGLGLKDVALAIAEDERFDSWRVGLFHDGYLVACTQGREDALDYLQGAYEEGNIDKTAEIAARLGDLDVVNRRVNLEQGLDRMDKTREGEIPFMIGGQDVRGAINEPWFIPAMFNAVSEGELPENFAEDAAPELLDAIFMTRYMDHIAGGNDALTEIVLSQVDDTDSGEVNEWRTEGRAYNGEAEVQIQSNPDSWQETVSHQRRTYQYSHHTGENGAMYYTLTVGLNNFRVEHVIPTLTDSAVEPSWVRVPAATDTFRIGLKTDAGVTTLYFDRPSHTEGDERTRPNILQITTGDHASTSTFSADDTAVTEFFQEAQPVFPEASIDRRTSAN